MKPFFSFSRFDRLLEEAGMRAMLFCRPSSFFYFTTLPWYERVHFSEMPGIYIVPISGYICGQPDLAFATASPQMDFPDFQAQNPWISDIRPTMAAVSRNADDFTARYAQDAKTAKKSPLFVRTDVARPS